MPEQLLYTGGTTSEGVVVDETRVANVVRRRHRRRRVDMVKNGGGGGEEKSSWGTQVMTRAEICTFRSRFLICYHMLAETREKPGRRRVDFTQ